MNTVGPYKNPTETYGYYEKLPFCKPKVLKHRIETLGEVLEGNRLASSGYDVHFLGWSLFYYFIIYLFILINFFGREKKKRSLLILRIKLLFILNRKNGDRSIV